MRGHFSAYRVRGANCRCDGYRPDILGMGLAWPVTFLALWELASKARSRVNPSISPDGNGIHKKHALNLPAMIGIKKPVMASGFKERIPRGVHPYE